ncbi:MAG: betaine-aldehyde dehydrogenase, partial [Actinobacteria bacterium]|nr:betaine-aldehyde dehydrogenase [Actinomycetota bacterium]
MFVHTIDVAGVQVDTRHYVNGERLASPATYTNTSPIDGSFLGEIARGDADAVNAAVAAARAAFPA